MSGYIGNIPVPQATQTRDAFVATTGQTVFATGGYTPNYVDVYLNGVKLVDGDDFTATNGSDIVLTVGATAGDQVEVIAFTAFNVMDVSYNDLLDVPTFATVATSGDYNDLINTPAPFDPNTLATVATTGSYTDLINIPANIVTDAAYVHTDNNYTTTEKNKLAGIETGATADQTAAEILTAIKTVDGSGSGLDADTLDGQHASAFATAAQGALADTAVQPNDSVTLGAVTATSFVGDGSGLTGLSVGLGVGQTWQAVTRTQSTNYTNSTGKPIALVVTYTATSVAQRCVFVVGGVTIRPQNGQGASSTYGGAFIIIPNGAVYQWYTSGGTASSITTQELR